MVPFVTGGAESFLLGSLAALEGVLGVELEVVDFTGDGFKEFEVAVFFKGVFALLEEGLATAAAIEAASFLDKAAEE